MHQNAGQKAVTPQMLRKFASTARERIRLDGGGYRRDHLRALAQRVEVAEGEVRIVGSTSRLLQTLVAGTGVNAVPTQGDRKSVVSGKRVAVRGVSSGRRNNTKTNETQKQ